MSVISEELKNDRNYSYFLYDSELKRRHDAALPTDEMYRYFPRSKDIITIDRKKPEESYRFIFNGDGCPKTDFEIKKLKEFSSYMDKQGKLKFPEWWLESDTLRFLQASEYDIPKTYKLIKENNDWLKTIPNTINKRIKDLLNYGFLYMYGRDRFFRPVIVVELKRVNELEDSNYTYEEINQCIVYFMNYIITYMLIPGQIENWDILTDFEGIGISSLGSFKKIIGTLSKYRGRVYRNYMINLGTFLKTGVKGAMNIMGSSSAKKIKILSGSELGQIQELIRRDNIQVKYSGSAKNVSYGENNLFPPKVPSKFYNDKEDNLNIISPDEYCNMYLNSKPFKPFVIKKEYEKIWKEEKEKNEQNEQKEKNKNSVFNEIIVPKSDRERKTDYSNEGQESEKRSEPRSQQLPQINPQRKNGNKNSSMINIKSYIRNFESMKMKEQSSLIVKNFPKKININEINKFFSNVKNNQNYFKIQ